MLEEIIYVPNELMEFSYKILFVLQLTNFGFQVFNFRYTTPVHLSVHFFVYFLLFTTFYLPHKLDIATI